MNFFRTVINANVDLTFARIPKHPRDTKIFVSYRNSDVPKAAKQITDLLRQRYGNVVYFQRYDNRLGVDVVAHTMNYLNYCTILIVVIGLYWEGELEEVGEKQRSPQKRILFVDDWVRREVEHGFDTNNDIQIVPILVSGKDNAVLDIYTIPLPPIVDEIRRLRHCQLAPNAIAEGMSQVFVEVDRKVPPITQRPLEQCPLLAGSLGLFAYACYLMQNGFLVVADAMPLGAISLVYVLTAFWDSRHLK